MTRRAKTFLLLLVFLLAPLSSGTVQESNYETNPKPSLHKGVVEINSRKLLKIDILDYEKAGANPRHEPGRRGSRQP